MFINLIAKFKCIIFFCKRNRCFSRQFITSFLHMDHFNCKNLLIEIYLKSVAETSPAKLIADNLRLDGNHLQAFNKIYSIKDAKIYLVGFGKAVLGMASQCEKVLQGTLERGIICVPENTIKTFENKDFALKPDSVIKVYEGAKNNLPDENAEKGADAIIQLVESLHEKHDILIVLISGGGSALFPKPKPEITLNEKLTTIALLASAGADIRELNTVRKKLSKVKGGGLACISYPVTTISFILSDVLNDSLDIIASGPTVLNLDSNVAALEIIKKYKLINKISKNVLNLIEEQYPFSKANHFIVNNKFCHVDNYLLGNNIKALSTAKIFSEECGFKSVILSSKMNGLVENVADFYLKFLKEIIVGLEMQNNTHFYNRVRTLLKQHRVNCYVNFLNEITKIMKMEDTNKKICIIAGGETTVKVHGNGKGGRNQELSLLILKKIYPLQSEFPKFFNNYNVMFLSAGTDGIDGPTDAAGAIVDIKSFTETKNSLNPDEYLARNDSYNFFLKTDGGSCLIKTGHSGTNVSDIHLLAIYKIN